MLFVQRLWVLFYFASNFFQTTGNLKAEKPEASEEELNYELAKAYESLFMDQMNDLQFEVHIGK